MREITYYLCNGAGRKFLLLTVLLTTFLVVDAGAQVRSGFGFLKLAPGARQSGIAGSVAGHLDYAEALFYNPGATGLMREWTLSAHYTSWISGLYNASFLYGQRLRLPWSRHSRVAVSVNYLGVPEFDSSGGVDAPVSANDLLLSFSFGQPLGFAGNRIALGGSVKYFRTDLADFTGSAAVFDAGVLYRTPRFRFLPGLFEEAIFSLGVSATNLGSSINVISEATPLPRTWRFGGAFNLGSHDGLQIGLSGDYRKVRDEDAFVSLGSEISWSQLLSLRFGYSFEDNLLGHLTFGASVRIDDNKSPFGASLPGRNRALRVDLASIESGDLTSPTYHGSAGMLPNAPEGFRMLLPADASDVTSDTLHFAWESSDDKDLFDAVEYRLFVTQDSVQIYRALDIARTRGGDVLDFLASLPGDINLVTQKPEVFLKSPHPGTYNWLVLAYDRDRHIRLASSVDGPIGRFNIAGSAIELTGITHDAYPWIDESREQGTLHFHIANTGKRQATGYVLTVMDSVGQTYTATAPDIAISAGSVIAELQLTALAPGESQIIEVPWQTTIAGLHHIRGTVESAGNGVRVSHSIVEPFHTVPKGVFFTADTVLLQQLTVLDYELPYVGKVFFDSSKSVVEPRFNREWLIEPLLQTLSRRLLEEGNAIVTLQGTADPSSGETDIGLADVRAHAVRDSLLALGAPPERIQIETGELLQPRRLPRGELDKYWILQERRRVDISTTDSLERILFAPIHVTFSERKVHPVVFQSRIMSVLPLLETALTFSHEERSESFPFEAASSTNAIIGDFPWELERYGSDSTEIWSGSMVEYALAVQDSLGRAFSSHPRDVHLQRETTHRQRMYFGVSRFGVAEPLYQFYWDNLLEKLPELLANPTARLRFVGHACAIGAEDINQRLSEKRASFFYDRFLRTVKRDLPQYYEEVVRRVDPPEGKGESQPFTFRNTKGESSLLGDNYLPTGRQLNRRVMAVIYYEE